MDRLTSEQRSALMGRIRCKDTKPERIVRSLLFGLGFRYRLHAPELVGKPDIVLPKYGMVIFVHGCFWHGHRNCKRAVLPATRTLFWSKKIAANRKRDSTAAKTLHRSGWEVITIWECQLKEPETLNKILAPLISRRENGLITNC